MRRKMSAALRFGSGVVTGILLAVVATVAVAASSTEISLEPEPGTLVIMSGVDQSNGKQRQELVDQWNKLHPRNPAKILEVPIGADAQSPPPAIPDTEVDIYNLDVVWTADFASRGYIRELHMPPVDTSGFLRKPLETCRFDGRLWALPFNTDAGLLYYQDIGLKEPTKWSDIVDETNRLFSGPHDSRLVAGYTAQFKDYEGLAVNAYEAIWAANGEILGADNVVRIDSPEAQTGLRRLADGLRKREPQVIHPDAMDHDETDSMNAFGQRQVAFMRNWPVAYRNLHTLSSDDARQPPFFKVTRLPGQSVLGGQNLAISAKSGQPKAARALIEFLTSPRSQQILFERGGFAATRELVYKDAEVQRQRPYAEILLAAIEDARLRPVHPCYVRFAKEFRGVVKAALRDGGRLPPDAVERLTNALKC